MKRLLKHLHSNKGEANISKTMLIAIAFVVGAILLIMITSSFRNPINNWFGKTNNDWFALENGDYPLNDNGTLRNMEYRGVAGPYQIVITSPETLVDGQWQSINVQRFNLNGELIDEVPLYANVLFLDGGTRIRATNGAQMWEATAQTPNIPEE